MKKHILTDDALASTVIHVQTLGQFTITADGLSIDNQEIQAKKPWNILEYLILHRNQVLSSEDLIDLIWGDTQSNNPVGALKTLVFRSRKLLEPLGLPPHKLILQRHGSYAWNEQVQTLVDADEFEALHRQTLDESLDEDRCLALCKQALELYKGRFLPRSSRESWVAVLANHYHSLFLQIAHKALHLLVRKEDWKSIILLCRHVISLESFEEDFHYSFIYALYSSGEPELALKQYRSTTDLFYDKLAITPSERLKDLYKIIQNQTNDVTSDLSIIQDSMQEKELAAGAYYCEFSVFRDIYQIQQRTIKRSGDSLFLCLLTVRTQQGDLPKASVMTKAMDALYTAISSSLRKGDVYCRYSIAQYMILLPADSYENGRSTMKRIVRNFKKVYSRRDLTIEYAVQAVILQN